MSQPENRKFMDNTLDFDRFEKLPARYFETMDRQELKKQLTQFIRELLENDFSRLCNLIYRHDVSESQFHRAMDVLDPEMQADRIADLVIERELQKVATRKAYRKYKEERDNNALEE